FGRLGWIADYPIMDNFLYPLFFTGTGDNRSQYSNTKFDQKIMKARTITDTAARLAAYQEADALLAEDCVVAPVMFYAHRHIGSEALKDFFFSPNMKATLNKANLA
ncbi:MAG: ABC transporter substrate-binding protein, partial [Coriobacteriales bacterium]|nr:ABC transporter substrate-binding protein [Coriobacteriales bacterium]